MAVKYIIMPVKYIIMPVTLTICACMGFALETILHNELYVCAGHLHYTILPDAFSHDATAALQIYM